MHTILAHNKLVTDIKFDKKSHVMVTSSFDMMSKVWSMPYVDAETPSILLRTLSGHENKVSSACFTEDLDYILTTSYDRTFKLWSMQKPEASKDTADAKQDNGINVESGK